MKYKQKEWHAATKPFKKKTIEKPAETQTSSRLASSLLRAISSPDQEGMILNSLSGLKMEGPLRSGVSTTSN
jgi:hypothetical protein